MKIYTKDGHLNIPEEAPIHYTAPAIAQDPRHLVRQVFCQNGHQLITDSNAMFDGYPGIELYCETDTRFDLVTLSPYLGDEKRLFDVDFEHHELLRICCPSCMNELLTLGPHTCQEGAEFVALYLNPDGDITHSVGICNAWNCHSAFLHAYGEIIARIRHDSVLPRC